MPNHPPAEAPVFLTITLSRPMLRDAKDSEELREFIVTNAVETLTESINAAIDSGV